jgi:hypothetical protein
LEQPLDTGEQLVCGDSLAARHGQRTADDGMSGGIERGDDDHWDLSEDVVKVLLRQQLKPIHVGHEEVEQDHIRPCLRHDL